MTATITATPVFNTVEEAFESVDVNGEFTAIVKVNLHFLLESDLETILDHLTALPFASGVTCDIQDFGYSAVQVEDGGVVYMKLKGLLVDYSS
jgi:succinyl-CoA synthetase alpha subunit